MKISATLDELASELKDSKGYVLKWRVMQIPAVHPQVNLSSAVSALTALFVT
jgi:hypothetical protein